MAPASGSSPPQHASTDKPDKSNKDDAQTPLASLPTETGKQHTEVETEASPFVPAEETPTNIECKPGNSQNDSGAGAEKIHTEMEKEPSPVARKDSFHALELELQQMPQDPEEKYDEHDKDLASNMHQEEEMNTKDVDMKPAFPPATERAGDKVPEEEEEKAACPCAPAGTEPAAAEEEQTSASPVAHAEPQEEEEKEVPPDGTEPATNKAPEEEEEKELVPATEPAAAAQEDENTANPVAHAEAQEQHEEEKAVPPDGTEPAATNKAPEEEEELAPPTEPAAAQEEENTASPVALAEPQEEKEKAPAATDKAPEEEEELAPATEPAAAEEDENTANPVAHAEAQEQQEEDEKEAPHTGTEPTAAADHLTATAHKEIKKQVLKVKQEKVRQGIRKIKQELAEGTEQAKQSAKRQQSHNRHLQQHLPKN